MTSTLFLSSFVSVDKSIESGKIKFCCHSVAGLVILTFRFSKQNHGELTKRETKNYPCDDALDFLVTAKMLISLYTKMLHVERKDNCHTFPMCTEEK